MKLIYRIQDADGRGPFKPGFSNQWLQDRPDHGNLVPWIVEFGPIHKKIFTWEHGGAGCTSKEQLRRWFTKKEYRKLKKFGYRCVKFLPSRILAESDIQAVFTRTCPLNQNIEFVKLY